MSTDYFGALLRSAGRAVPAAPIAPAQAASTGVDSVEIDVEREALPASRSPAAVPPLQAQGTPIEASPADAAAAGPVASKSTTPRDGNAATPGPEVVDLAPPVLHDAVRAALFWVASGPQAQAAPDHRGMRAQSPASPVSGAPSSRGIDETARADALTLSQPSIDTKVLAPAEARATATRSPQSATPATEGWHEELVEVSIGAIHLRVHAPTPATVAQAPAPSAPAPVRASSARSPLSRRALYRI